MDTDTTHSSLSHRQRIPQTKTHTPTQLDTPIHVSTTPPKTNGRANHWLLSTASSPLHANPEQSPNLCSSIHRRRRIIIGDYYNGTTTSAKQLPQITTLPWSTALSSVIPHASNPSSLNTLSGHECTVSFVRAFPIHYRLYPQNEERKTFLMGSSLEIIRVHPSTENSSSKT